MSNIASGHAGTDAHSDTELRVLGPLEVWTPAGTQHLLPPGRHHIVLGMLLLEANRLVSIEALVDAVWYDDPPATARTQVQICVSGLRASLARTGLPVKIVTRAPGYVLQVMPESLDAQVFATLVAESAALTRDSRPAQAVELLHRANSLWRGPTLAGVPSMALRAKAMQWDEKRLSAAETCADLDLQLGRHHQVIGELGPLLEEHPLRERLRGQLMLALYRAGRKADALSQYRLARELLIDHTGLEPGDELRRLHRAILSSDARLRLTSDEPDPIVLSGVSGPHQLPTDIADFTGRAGLLDDVRDTLTIELNHHAVPIAVLVGKPGIGKTSLAVHAGHDLIDTRFPDGQLFADLGGTRGEQIPPAEVLGRFLRALDVPGPAIPVGLDERAELFRDLLSRRRILIVLDDAVSEAQVWPLLPGSNTCGVIVTSRARLTGLPGARVFEVDVMDTESALTLLSRVVGHERVEAEPAAATALVRLVGGLPLALRVVVTRLVRRPHWTLASMVERLADERRRLDELALGELGVRASLALSYDGLTPTASRLFRLLGGVDGDSIPAWVATALLDCDPQQAEDLLEILVDAQMLEVAGIDVDGTPRYRFHEIIRIFAGERLESAESGEERLSATRRLVGGWLSMAAEAHRRIYGGDHTALRSSASTRDIARSHADQVLTQPMRWLEAERANLCAAVTLAADSGLDEHCWDLAVTLVTLFEAGGYFQDWERTHRRALEAVRSKGNHRGVAALMCSLGSLQLSRSRTASAEDLLLPALETFDEIGDLHGRALVHRNLGLLDLLRGHDELAEQHYRLALADFAAVGDRVGQAHVLSQIVHLQTVAGAFDSAQAHLDEALRLCAEMGSQRIEVRVRYRRCGLMVALGRLESAAAELTDLLAIVRAGHDVVGEARILHQLSVVGSRLGRAADAEVAMRAAMASYEQVKGRAGAALAVRDLAALTEMPSPDRAFAI